MTENDLTPISRYIWETKYRLVDGDMPRDQDIQATWQRVASALARLESGQQSQYQERFRHLLDGFRFLPGGRILAGAGSGHQVTLFNCFVMGEIDDSIDGIFDALKQGAITMQQGGGVGYDFSSLRPQGVQAHRVGTIASGPVSFMRIWDSMCATILSTGARRGAMMATLRCDHPDIETFITAKHDPRELRHFNLSVLVSDDFMAAVERDADWPLMFPLLADDKAEANTEIVKRTWPGRKGEVSCRVYRRVPARVLWDKLMHATYDYAEPGVLFIDRINRLNTLSYRERIAATNPCVTVDTWVQTVDGPRQVRELIGKPFHALVDGQAYASAPQGFFQTGDRQIYELKTQEGHFLHLTSNHPVRRIGYLTRWTMETSWVRVEELKPGDKVLLHDHRNHGQWAGAYGEDEGYLLGLLLGDGTFSEDAAELRVWPGKIAIGDDSKQSGVLAVMGLVENIVFRMPHRSDFIGWRISTSGYHFLKLAHLTKIAKELGVVPRNKRITPAIERCSSDFYRGLLRGLFDTDGSIQGTQQKGVSVRLAQSDSQMLESVQRMLLRLGIVSIIYRERRPSMDRLMPDGRGGSRLYPCKANHEIVIAGDNLFRFRDLIGFGDIQKHSRLESSLAGYKRKPNRPRFYAEVISINPVGMESVYDVQIPGINAFDANGFYVHNCGEIPLPPYGACDLGAINLTRFVDAPFTAQVRIDLDAVAECAAQAVRFLDNVIDVSQFPLPEQRAQAQGSRRIGLGITGLADTLIMLGLHYDSDKARAIAGSVMKTICHSAYRASIALAGEKGPFPFFEREAYLQGEFVRTLPLDLREAIARQGIRNSHLTAIAPTGTISLLANNVSSGLEPVHAFHYQRRILVDNGCYQTFSIEDDAHRRWRALYPQQALPDYFVTAAQLAPQAHLAMQAALQPYVDNAISKTITVPETYEFSAFRDLYLQAFKLGLKGCTTFRSNPVTGSVLLEEGSGDQSSHCCNMEREAD